MFKSVFAKYVTAVMLIFVVGFAVLLFVLTSIVDNSISQSKADEMEVVANDATVTVQEAIGGRCGAGEFPARLVSLLNDSSLRLAEILNALTATDSDMTILLTDTSGVALFRIGNGETVTDPEVVLPDVVMESLQKDGAYLGVVCLNDLYSSQVMARATQISDADGQPFGILVVTSTGVATDGMMSDLTATVISAALLVLLAILIAVYCISERVTSPLRGMCNATKQFANGNFDVRVPVSNHGRDEVAQLATAFNQMAESLENLENLRNSFIANVSHDLRTPMTTIIGFIEEIRDGVIPPEEQDHYLEIILTEARRLSRLVSSLLDLSRIQAGDRKFTPRPFDICEMARLILISFEQQIDEKKLEVEFTCDEDRMTVFADHDAIYQIFYNICHNAVKFSKEGGGLRIRIRADKDKKVLVSVYNEGQGIPEADLPYVFDRFYKSDKSRGLDKTGVGLGLFIAKTIIRAHGEKIWVESEEGKYCEFFFTLSRGEPAQGN